MLPSTGQASTWRVSACRGLRHAGEPRFQADDKLLSAIGSLLREIRQRQPVSSVSRKIESNPRLVLLTGREGKSLPCSLISEPLGSMLDFAQACRARWLLSTSGAISQLHGWLMLKLVIAMPIPSLPASHFSIRKMRRQKKNAETENRKKHEESGIWKRLPRASQNDNRYDMNRCTMRHVLCNEPVSDA